MASMRGMARAGGSYDLGIAMAMLITISHRMRFMLLMVVVGMW